MCVKTDAVARKKLYYCLNTSAYNVTYFGPPSALSHILDRLLCTKSQCNVYRKPETTSTHVAMLNAKPFLPILSTYNGWLSPAKGSESRGLSSLSGLGVEAALPN